MRTFFVALSVVLISGCFSGSGGSETPRKIEPTVEETIQVEVPAPLPSSSVWVVMGSSSATGTGASTFEQSWSRLLRDDMTGRFSRFSNIAREGYTTYQALSVDDQPLTARPQPDPEHNVDKALSLGADFVLLSFGSNDVTRNYSVGEIARNFRLIRQRLEASGVVTMVLSSQPRSDMSPEQVARQRELDRVLQQDFGPCFVPVFDALATEQGALRPEYDYDDVHLNDAGHWLVYEAVRDRIASNQCVF